MSALDVSDAGTLYIVSTPIGNLGDISYRGVEILKSVALVVAEDTRHSRTLLAHYEIGTRLSAYHEHNEAKESPRIVARMLAGESVALISDAGTPLVSDPGARLVRAAIDAGVDVVPIPGASALLAALVASGLDATSFTFVGFLPRKGNERVTAINAIATSRVTTIFYESPQRLADTLHDLVGAGCGTRDAVVSRELTKKFEETLRGTVSDLAAKLDDGVRGEIVVAVAGAADAAPDDEAAARVAAELRANGAKPRDVLRELVASGVARNMAYRLAHEAGSAHEPEGGNGD